MPKIKSNTGFTLVEILVVISVIGILISMITSSFSSSQKQARDTARKSDMNQYRTSLESYANKNDGLYPTSSINSVSRTNPANLCTALGLGTTCAVDPKTTNENYYYSYISDIAGTPLGSAKATQYVLWAILENTPPTTYWFVCSSGKNGTTLNLTPSTNGVCPI
jgi:prepilin-type N-terminal cleavage/methylation domain-containing protein